ncbi:hypothetical protein PTTG_27128 [Puccinia triticina 1-1 BBBD Race 1]|uniref:Uncharacterized protein n=1 Tax=Puccinia triticina (isolate 1-1 / race 1 (BBBD)) TaxID=630390 RepID=A0A180GMJ9_PUCT1|nr:hypothetical protein PTTG_27128 [Puccinia triticina 1-1 BBBD Race 1]
MAIDWSKEEIIQLRAVLLTQIDILADWDWNHAKQDLKIIADILELKVEPYEEPSPLILSSGLMTFEPSRSAQAQSRLPRFDQADQTRRRRRPKVDYDPSILAAAQFLFGHIPAFNSHLDKNIFSLETDQPVLFKLITEFSKVYRVRLMIYELCSTDWAFNKLLVWDESLKTKTLSFFDDEPDRWSKTKELFDRELARGTNDEPVDTW